jgi:hypothetical protein
MTDAPRTKTIAATTPRSVNDGLRASATTIHQ